MTAICGRCAMCGAGSGVLTTRPFPLTSGPDALHVAIPAQTGSRIFAFSFRSRRELDKLDPRDDAFDCLSLDTHTEEASVSPDGQMVVYSDRPDGSLWRSRTDGSQRLRLTSPPLSGLAPQWSPKGEQILFTGVRAGQARQIYIVASDGGALRPVLPEGWEGAQADWSPDGYRIVVIMRNLKTHPQYGALYAGADHRDLERTAGFERPQRAAVVAGWAIHRRDR